MPSNNVTLRQHQEDMKALRQLLKEMVSAAAGFLSHRYFPDEKDFIDLSRSLDEVLDHLIDEHEKNVVPVERGRKKTHDYKLFVECLIQAADQLRDTGRSSTWNLLQRDGFRIPRIHRQGYCGRHPSCSQRLLPRFV
jgi:hypothetical protein